MNTINHVDEWEMAEKHAIMVARSIIRLKYRILADTELNQVLPQLQDTVRKAVANGESWEMDVRALMEENL